MNNKCTSKDNEFTKKYDVKRSKRTSKKGNSNKSKVNFSDTTERTQKGYDAGNRKANNDPQWYLNSQMGMDVATFNFNMPNGYPINFNPSNSNLKSTYIPGIVTIATIPTLGYADQPTDPINMAAINQFSYIRGHYSGDAPYESTDLMMYEVAIANILAALFYMKRAYGIANLYSPLNKYMPQALLEAQGWDFSSVIKSMPTFHWYIENLTNRVSQLACPGNMDIFKKYAFMYANLYTESDSTIKDQLYMYVPQGFLKFVSHYDSNGSALVFEPMDSTMKNPFYMFTYVNELIEQLIEDTGVRRISADIMGVYKDDVLKFESFPNDYLIVPVYNKSVLEQMKNVEAFPVNPLSCAVTQQHGEAGAARSWIVSKPQPTDATKDPNNYWANDSMLVTDAPNASPELIMELTRFKWACTKVMQGSTYKECKLYTGTFIATDVTIWCFDEKPDGTLFLGSSSYDDVWYATGSDSYDQVCEYHPMRYGVRDLGNNKVKLVPRFLISNYTMLNSDAIKKLHETAILSLFTPHN